MQFDYLTQTWSTSPTMVVRPPSCVSPCLLHSMIIQTASSDENWSVYTSPSFTCWLNSPSASTDTEAIFLPNILPKPFHSAPKSVILLSAILIRNVLFGINCFKVEGMLATSIAVNPAGDACDSLDLSLYLDSFNAVLASVAFS